MYCVIFKSKLKNTNDQEYKKTADQMLNLAKEQNGFISFEHYFSEPTGHFI
ncbi:hypothetical protein L3V86_02090 [Thiotrichales bacterium 19S11-10]|nr:hypothetical protein [Thiotrichales bacterium 19S11-10]MCF6808179.1 hypothetical protein [Thiotrichales bacterium 19S9-11]MCF6812195.1 hypothetical protein [Thiotrichales bacterium 19S9-12]